jgi:transposase
MADQQSRTLRRQVARHDGGRGKRYPAALRADLRKGYNGLYGLVERELRRDVLEGELFLFVNRRRTSCKVLVWDGTGLCIFAKRLEGGRFASLWR